MQDLKKLFGKVLAEKKIASISKWAMVLALCEKILKNEFWINKKLEWKIENNILVLKINNSNLSNMIFLHKKKVVDKINQQLNKMDLDEIKDIKFF